jgi:phosphatidylserine/phosphatidylglycerophosphate/cardiolipin synthase-like enzyme
MLSDTIRIQPLLTPDNYHEHVNALIESAKRTFYMQTQCIHPSGHAGDEDHDALIAAVKTLVDKGLDVRLITSQYQTEAWVEKLAHAGVPASVLRRQANVHNKGIVVDGSTVMVSSQNWSADGTLRNRDAGFIIHHAEAAAYFEQIFLHDWANLASPVDG